jgi:hypothetical protein
MASNPSLANGNGYIIVYFDCFTKCVGAMHAYSNDFTIVALLVIDHIITRFGMPKTIIMDHKSHFSSV